MPALRTHLDTTVLTCRHNPYWCLGSPQSWQSALSDARTPQGGENCGKFWRFLCGLRARLRPRRELCTDVRLVAMSTVGDDDLLSTRQGLLRRGEQDIAGLEDVSGAHETLDTG